jgi:hypothetical protein
MPHSGSGVFALNKDVVSNSSPGVMNANEKEKGEAVPPLKRDKAWFLLPW